MKILIYTLALLACLSGCRTKSSLTETRKETVVENMKEQTVAIEQSGNKSWSMTDQLMVDKTASTEQTASTGTKDSESDEYEFEETKIDIFDKDGNLRATVHNTKQMGRTDRKKEQTKSSNTSNVLRIDSVSTKTSEQSETDITNIKTSKSEQDLTTTTHTATTSVNSMDNRLIQGSEWFYVVGAVCVIVLVCVIVYCIRKRKQW